MEGTGRRLGWRGSERRAGEGERRRLRRPLALRRGRGREQRARFSWQRGQISKHSLRRRRKTPRTAGFGPHAHPTMAHAWQEQNPQKEPPTHHARVGCGKKEIFILSSLEDMFIYFRERKAGWGEAFRQTDIIALSSRRDRGWKL